MVTPGREIANAQRGSLLVDLYSHTATGAPRARSRSRIPARTRVPSLTTDERTQIVDTFVELIEGLYTHLPLKRAMYAIDPLQRLRLLRQRISTIDDWELHSELAATMTSLSDLSPGRLVDREVAIHVFLQRLEKLVTALRAGEFPAETWSHRQLTNGMIVMLDQPDGTQERVFAEDVDTETGALLVRATGEDQRRPVVVGEIRHLRVGGIV